MTTLLPADLRWLDAAARYATPYRGTTAENPTVGALIVDPTNAVLVSRAVTAAGGRPHAETQAIALAGSKAKGATLYVTLEPCNNQGRTPPCASAVIASGIGRVVCGLQDPDPRTAGEGLNRLRAAGIEVALVGDHATSMRLHEGHLMRHSQGRPFVTAKLAVSRDGMIGRPGQANVPITSDDARRWTHMKRALSDAVMVGAGTALTDDPRLDVRLKGLECRSPRTAVLAGLRELPARLRLFDALRAAGQTIVIHGPGAPPVPDAAMAIEVDGTGGRPDLARALAVLCDEGIADLLVEGGAELTAGLLAGGLIDRFELLLGDSDIGSPGIPAARDGGIVAEIERSGLVRTDSRMLGSDRLVTYERAR
ncbi:MAG TPA: bifunctional diaminohydroxyphosphoribosylaminopyrimidine deaminase/5-amino-6-(5-phosphoribosylamino)uracil reductase RibD [Devosiaceae bacterium]